MKLFLLSIAAIFMVISAQSQCIFKDTLFNIDFGTASRPQEFNLQSMKAYSRDFSDCPGDGYYAYSFRTSECFNGDWITLKEDHTPGDQFGKMLFVNANPNPAGFFKTILTGFKPNTPYEFGVWMLNLCKINGGCSPLPPNILISLTGADGTKIASFQTGSVSSQAVPSWKRYFANFTTPANVSAVTLEMRDLTRGGCGNDFAMDDLIIRECYPPPPPIPVSTPPVTPPPVPVVKIPESKPEKTEPEKTLQRRQAAEVKTVDNQKNRQGPDINRKARPDLEIADVLKTRENPVIKSMLLPESKIHLQVYDNGQIDGDTVSIFHNGELIINHRGISDKPIEFDIQLSKEQTHHEIIMVADNLGSIPPNTSLMVITAGKKRFEVFISSSEKKNAKIVIDLE